MAPRRARENAKNAPSPAHRPRGPRLSRRRIADERAHPCACRCNRSPSVHRSFVDPSMSAKSEGYRAAWKSDLVRRLVTYSHVRRVYERGTASTSGAAAHDRLSTLARRVRHALRPAAKRARRPSWTRPTRGGGDLEGDARGAPRAPRGRRQPGGRERLHGDGEGACAGAGGAQEPLAGPAGRQDRPRGAHRVDGLRGVSARVRTSSDRDSPRRATGVGQDHRGGQAGTAFAQRGQATLSGRVRSPATGGDRATRAARPADTDPRVPPGHEGRSSSCQTRARRRPAGMASTS